jgi:hypothetical protein
LLYSPLANQMAASRGGDEMFTLLASAPPLISTETLNRFFSAGAAVACRELRYVHAAELIVSEAMIPQRVASMFKLSACKTAKPDCAFVLLCGSVSKYRAAPATWSAEPEGSMARALVGGDFALVSDQAAKFVAKHWLRIEALAGSAEAA